MTIDDFNKQQLTQFGRLHKVKDKLNQLCEGLSLLDLKVYTETADDLNNIHNSQSNRLDKIRNKLNSMCDDLSLTHLKIAEQIRTPASSTIGTAKSEPSEQTTVKANQFNRVTSKVNVRQCALVLS
jgi:hypothetical protein